jgi:NTE family protein
MQNSVFESKMNGIKNCMVIRPKLEKYKLTDFTQAGDIIDIGYDEGKKIIREVLFE